MSGTEVYHVGQLAVDRVSDPLLDRRAQDYLERATPLGCAVYVDQVENGPRGRGEGFLTQRKLWDGVYEYRFHPLGIAPWRRSPTSYGKTRSGWIRVAEKESQK